VEPTAIRQDDLLIRPRAVIPGNEHVVWMRGANAKGTAPRIHLAIGAREFDRHHVREEEVPVDTTAVSQIDGSPGRSATGCRPNPTPLPDVMPIELTRTYRQMDARCRAFGVGTTHPYDMFITGDHRPWTYQEIILRMAVGSTTTASARQALVVAPTPIPTASVPR